MAQLHVAKVVLVGEEDPVGSSGVAVTRVSVKNFSLYGCSVVKATQGTDSVVISLV